MTKLIAVFLLLAMAVHIVKPLNLPGLRRRVDFWRIALFAFAVWTVALVLNEAL